MAALRCWLIATALLGLAACQPKTAGDTTPADPAREADAIRGGEADRAIEMGDKDLDKAAGHFAPSAMLVWPGAQPVRGSVEIKAFLAEAFKDPAFAVEWKTEKITVAKDGDLGWASGRFSLTRTDPATRQPVTVKGPFLETFSKADADGRWLISASVMSPTPPPPADQ